MQLESRFKHLPISILGNLDLTFFIPIPIRLTLTPNQSILFNIHDFVPECFFLEVSSRSYYLSRHVFGDKTTLLVEFISYLPRFARKYDRKNNNHKTSAAAHEANNHITPESFFLFSLFFIFLLGIVNTNFTNPIVCNLYLNL